VIVKYDDKENIAFVDEPLTKEIVRTIECKPPIIQKVVFHRTATLTDETRSVEGYSEWETENSAWSRIEIPEREGYDVSPKVVEFKEVNADTENETVFVKYEADFEKIELDKSKPYAQRKEKPPLPPVEEIEEHEEIEKVENSEEHKETEEFENNEEVKNFVSVEIKKDKIYAQRKEKPPLPSVEEVKKIEEAKKDKLNESLDSDVASSQIKKQLLKSITEKANSELADKKEKADSNSVDEKEKVDSNSVDEKEKTDSKILSSAKETSLSKARQSLISKQNKRSRQKEAFRNYQQQKYHEKMNACVHNVRVQKPIQINDIGRFSAETISFLNELKEIGEETLTREKWKVTLFAK